MRALEQNNTPRVVINFCRDLYDSSMMSFLIFRPIIDRC